MMRGKERHEISGIVISCSNESESCVLNKVVIVFSGDILRTQMKRKKTIFIVQ